MNGSRLRGDLDHRSDERGRDSVPRNVGDEKTSAVIVDGKIFVEVTGNRSHGFINSGDAQIADFGSRRGKNGELQLARDSEFVLYRDEAALAGVHLAHRDVCEGEQKGEETGVVPDAVDAVAEGPYQVGQQGFSAKDDRTCQQNSTILDSTVLPVKGRDAEKDNQNEKSDDGDDGVRAEKRISLTTENEIPKTSYGDDECATSEKSHDLAKPAHRELTECAESGHEHEVRGKAVRV